MSDLKIASGYVYRFLNKEGDVVYVGKTIDPIHRRHRGHLSAAASDNDCPPFGMWLREQQADGYIPAMQVIEEVPLAQLDERETYWIRHYHALRGDGLLNVARVPGRKPTPREAPPRYEPPPIACVVCGSVIGDETVRLDLCDACLVLEYLKREDSMRGYYRRKAIKPTWNELSRPALGYQALLSGREKHDVPWDIYPVPRSGRFLIRWVSRTDATAGRYEQSSPADAASNEMASRFWWRQDTEDVTALALLSARGDSEKTAAIWWRAVHQSIANDRRRLGSNRDLLNLVELAPRVDVGWHHRCTNALPIDVIRLPMMPGVCEGDPWAFAELVGLARDVTSALFRIAMFPSDWSCEFVSNDTASEVA